MKRICNFCGKRGRGKEDGSIFYKKYGPDFLGETFRVLQKSSANTAPAAWSLKHGTPWKGRNEMPDSGMMAVRSIRYWLNDRDHYPAPYNMFFVQWMLFNSYYSKYRTGDKKSVMKFANEHGDILWGNDKIQSVAKEFSEIECVGEGIGANPPHLEVKSATIFLRELLGIDHDRICSNICREEKKLQCSSVRLSNWEGNPASALLRISYQIRCNLFHGDKLEYTGQEGTRNLFLVECGIKTLSEILTLISGLE